MSRAPNTAFSIKTSSFVRGYFKWMSYGVLKVKCLCLSLCAGGHYMLLQQMYTLCLHCISLWWPFCRGGHYYRFGCTICSICKKMEFPALEWIRISWKWNISAAREHWGLGRFQLKYSMDRMECYKRDAYHVGKRPRPAPRVFIKNPSCRRKM